MNRASIATLVCCTALVAGCLGSTAQQSMTSAPPTPPPMSAPASEESHASAQATQQSGQGNLTGQVDAHGWTGIEYSRTDAVPIGQVVLMAMMLLLSHRREMARIKQNGKCHSGGTTTIRPYELKPTFRKDGNVKPPTRTPRPDVTPAGQGQPHARPAHQERANRAAKGSSRCRSR